MVEFGSAFEPTKSNTLLKHAYALSSAVSSTSQSASPHFQHAHCEAASPRTKTAILSSQSLESIDIDQHQVKASASGGCN